MSSPGHKLTMFALGAAIALGSLLVLGSTSKVVAQTVNPCLADVDKNNYVDLTDYSLFGSVLFKNASVNTSLDYDNSGFIDLSDYSVFSTSFILGDANNCNAPTITNLLNNPGFESGSLSSWGGTSPQVVQTEKHSGSYAVKYTSSTTSPLSQGWFTVTPGKTYVLTAYFKWVQFSGDGWGYDILALDQQNGNNLEYNNLHAKYEQNTWNKIAISVIPTTNKLQVRLGMFGPRANVELYFDDIALFEKSGNAVPTLSPSASVTSGQAPLNVNFTSSADDLDGAIAVYDWNFGDGSKSRSATPSHKFISAGAYDVNLTVYDDQGGKAAKTLRVNVTAPDQPVVTFTQPTSNQTTTNSTLSMTGTATVGTGQVSTLVWDNVNTGDGGKLSIIPSGSVNWSAASIKLKPGKNEILITASTNSNKVGTNKIIITRQQTAPVISAVTPVSTQIPVYDKYELSFQLQTVADNVMYAYDENPPQGIAPKTGVTAEGVFTSPSGKVLRQPAFYRTKTQKSGSVYTLTANNDWAVRFSPSEVGTYKVSLSVKDASGTATYDAGTFTATSSSNKGFVQVSKTDSRYFEYSDGSLFWPIGPADDVFNLPSGAMNLVRVWLGGSGIYSTNWARWKSSAESQGNEGVMSPLNYKETYPGSELSYQMYYPQGARIWITSWLDDNFAQIFKNNTNYQVKLRVKVVDIAGPANASKPWGLTVKRHPWSGQNANYDLSPYASLITPIQTTQDWHTVIGQFNSGNSSDRDLSITLENVTAGQAYIDELSIREILPDGSLGAELIRNPKSDMFSYVEQRPAAYIDDLVESGRSKGITFKFVVEDKNDWIPNHLSPFGVFVDYGGGYYQPAGTKSRWFDEQWWRYLSARWGYSTSIHSWELNNEGPPDDGSGGQARMTQDFAAFLKKIDAHPHMATTSFWCCWEPTFWGDRTRFPDVAYADLHEYTESTDAAKDMAAWTANRSLDVGSSHVGIPVMRGETGINGDPYYSMLTKANSGLWYHNLLWAQLNSGAMSDPLYWHAEQLKQINQVKEATNFYKFMSVLDLNKGGYVDLAPNVSNSNLRVYGQKNVAKGEAQLWVQNKNNTWYNKATGVSVANESGTVTLQLAANTTYTLNWWDTYNGTVNKTEQMTSNSQGTITLNIQSLGTDVALKISK